MPADNPSVILAQLEDGIAACTRAQLVADPRDHLLARKIRRAHRALEDARTLVTAKAGTAHLAGPGRS